MALTFDTHSTSLLIQLNASSNLRPKAAIASKKIIIFTFSHIKAYVTKFDLGVK